MTINELNLKPIIDVNINLSLKSAPRKGFNIGLILGKGSIISLTERVRLFTSADSLLSAGFATDSPEYKAAQIYFSQSSAPDFLCVGVKGEEEDIVDALRACRAANSAWYVVSYLGAEDVDIKKAAAWCESAEPTTLYSFTTHDPKVLDSTGAEDDIFIAMKKLGYRRTYGQYCGDEETPADIATMGYAMGANRGTADSAFTLAYKTLKGVTTDDLSEAQVSYIAGFGGNNGNVYVNRAESYNILQQGYMADGTSFDEILNLDMLQNEITLNVMDLLYTNPKVPQTESGVTAIVNQINIACDKFVNNGFIAPGKWNGARCLELNTGDYLATGYCVQSESIDSQSQADRDARKAPPIYVCIKLAGAIEFVIIEVNVNR